MVVDAVVTFSDGKVNVPKEVQEKMHLTEGTRLRLVSSSNTEMRFEVESFSNKPWVPNDNWRSLRGILSGHPEHDTSKVLHEERMWELEHDERKFGPSSNRED
jgi:hypothetical protein